MITMDQILETFERMEQSDAYRFVIDMSTLEG